MEQAFHIKFYRRSSDRFICRKQFQRKPLKNENMSTRKNLAHDATIETY